MYMDLYIFFILSYNFAVHVSGAICTHPLEHKLQSTAIGVCNGYGMLTLSDPMLDLVRHYDFPVPHAFPHVVRTLANRKRSLYSFCFCFSLLKL
jgi:hypothetical protein